MSILSALKSRGAKGKNIEEAVKTLPIGGGSGGGVLVVNGTIDGATMTLDKTWQEIHDAGTVVLIFEFDADTQVSNWLTMVYYTNGEYGCTFIGGNKIEFHTDSADGYPSATMG